MAVNYSSHLGSTRKVVTQAWKDSRREVLGYVTLGTPLKLDCGHPAAQIRERKKYYYYFTNWVI